MQEEEKRMSITPEKKLDPKVEASPAEIHVEDVFDNTLEAQADEYR